MPVAYLALCRECTVALPEWGSCPWCDGAILRMVEDPAEADVVLRLVYVDLGFTLAWETTARGEAWMASIDE